MRFLEKTKKVFERIRFGFKVMFADNIVCDADGEFLCNADLSAVSTAMGNINRMFKTYGYYSHFEVSKDCEEILNIE